MLSSQTICDFELSTRTETAPEAAKQLASFFEAARGAFSRNTERALWVGTGIEGVEGPGGNLAAARQR